MAGYNRVVMIGNLTRDPDYKQLQSGQAVCRLGLATNRQFKNRQTGSMVQEVCYVDIDVWGPQAESCKQYLQKGRPVLIEGRLKFDTWEDPNGQTRSKHSIVADRVVFLSSGTGAGAELAEEETPQDPKAKELFDQIDQIKQRQAAGRVAQAAAVRTDISGVAKEAPVVKKAKKTNEAVQASTDGEISFKDEQPFLEDLPF